MKDDFHALAQSGNRGRWKAAEATFRIGLGHERTDPAECFEVILLLPRVIEGSYVQGQSVSRDLARGMFAAKHARGDYCSVHVLKFISKVLDRCATSIVFDICVDLQTSQAQSALTMALQKQLSPENN